MKNILIIILSIFCGSSIAQTLKTFSGLYNGGHATNTYYESSDGEFVYHDKFRIHLTIS